MVIALGWQGVDHAAQAYRVTEVRHFGLVIWDSGWYAGNYPLGYSVLLPVLGALFGVTAVAVGAAGVAAWAFDRLMLDQSLPHLDRGGAPVRPWGSWYFAASTALAVGIGQLPYLSGEAAGLVAVLALTRRRGWTAVCFALVAALCSPLAAAFLALLCGVAWVAGCGVRRQLVAVAGTCAAVVAAVGVLFPGVGPFPFPWTGLALALGVCAALFFVTGPAARLVHVAAVAYGLACVASFLIANPLGGNAPRLAAEIGVPLLASLPWQPMPAVRRRLGQRGTSVVASAVLAGLIVWQWAPGRQVDFSARTTPSAHQGFYRPLVDQLAARQAEPMRAEVVPVRNHEEAAWLAPRISLARGWERQIDLARNPLFYRPGALTAASYRHWLNDNGVEWVALPSAPLDYAGRAEAALLHRGQLPGLQSVWTSAQWQLWQVVGSPGLVTGPGRLITLRPDRLTLQADESGTYVIRVRWMRYWQVTSGAACVAAGHGGWTELRVTRPGPVTLTASLPAYRSAACS